MRTLGLAVGALVVGVSAWLLFSTPSEDVPAAAAQVGTGDDIHPRMEIEAALELDVMFSALERKLHGHSSDH